MGSHFGVLGKIEGNSDAAALALYDLKTKKPDFNFGKRGKLVLSGHDLFPSKKLNILGSDMVIASQTDKPASWFVCGTVSKQDGTDISNMFLGKLDSTGKVLFGRRYHKFINTSGHPIKNINGYSVNRMTLSSSGGARILLSGSATLPR